MRSTNARTARAAQAHETVQILGRGHYRAADGTLVEVAGPVAAAVAGTVEYGPDAALPDPDPVRGGRTRVRVEDAGTFAAAARLVADGYRPTALNFASAKHPGGGFLNGAQAQEETLCRDSALFACLRDRELYRVNAARRDALYTHALIYSPAVPVLRADDGALLARPWSCAVVTAPAPNAGVVLQRDPGRAPELDAALRERARRVLAVAARHEHRELVLGAWGCGVFRNDPAQVAGVFADLLAGRYAGVFDLVVFAVLDGSRDRATLRAFQERLG